MLTIKLSKRRQQEEIERYKKQIIFLEEYIKAQQLRQFANKSEKLNASQLQFFDEAKPVKDEEKILAAEEEIQVASFARKKSTGRKALSADLSREQRIYDRSRENLRLWLYFNLYY